MGEDDRQDTDKLHSTQEVGGLIDAQGEKALSRDIL
jgi:hypothetical protein